MCNIIPTILMILRFVLTESQKTNFKIIKQYKFGILFLIFLTFGLFTNISIVYDLVSKRYLPLLFFFLFLLYRSSYKINTEELIKFFRTIFIAMIILYFYENYLPITKSLIESDTIFSVSLPKNSYSLVYLSITRNMGIFWDHRILAIFSYLYLILILAYKKNNYLPDILISFLVVLSSTSRGGIITYLLILLTFIIHKGQIRNFIVGAILLIILTLGFNVSKKLIDVNKLNFLKSFNITSQYNALSQRKVFSSIALEAFRKKPIFGNGVGFLSSINIERNLYVDGTYIPAVGDAYWYILLAEMGIVGLLLYFLFLVEVFNSFNLFNIALFFGFCIQLLGTDIPDMRFYYYSILVIVFLVNEKLSGKNYWNHEN